jgi:hypothetical protein
VLVHDRRMIERRQGPLEPQPVEPVQLAVSRCDQTRTLCDQTRIACAIKGGQTAFARVFRSRSVAKAEENLRLRLFPCTLER